jgi:cell division protein FtsQ
VRRRWVLLAGVAVALLVVGAAWVVLASSITAVTSVVVVGAQRTSPDAVRAAAQTSVGRPLLRVDLAGIERRVDAIPQVASATVTRVWPHTLRITVVERVPAATYRTADGTWLLLDPTGVVVGQAVSRPAGLVLVTTDPTGSDQAALTAAATVAGSLPTSLRAKVRSVFAASADSVQLTLTSGATVRWGSAQDTALKARVLAALMTRRASVYDVSAPGAPTTRT